MKICTGCKEEKQVSDFNKDRGKKDGLQSRCKTCCRVATQKWNEANPARAKELNKKAVKTWQSKNRETLKENRRAWMKANPEKAREYHLLAKYGISAEKTEELRIKQNNKCAICLEEKKLCVDHCHKTGEVRGLLCRECNLMLGNALDNVETLSRAIQYLA